MKNILKLLLLATGILFMYSSCKKIDNLPSYANGLAPVLTSSATNITPAPSDSNKNVVTFSWSNPKYATDSSTQKFILEIDSTGRNFSKEITSTVSGKLNISFTGQQLNNILASFGFTPGQSFSFDIRVTSSYGNNNNQLKSNVIKVSITSYLVPIILVPSSTNALTLLVINASNTAVSFNWNSSPYGTSNTINYALQMDVVGGSFASPQVLKYGTALTSGITVNDLNALAIAAGVIGGSTKNVEFRIVSYLGTTYTTPLVYSNAVTISITTFTPIPPTLYIVGDATPGGWSNPVPLPSQQFTRIDAVSYGIVVNLTAGKSYVFLPLNGDWTHKYGGASATGGALLADNAVPGSNTPAPATSGMYQIVVNFQTGTYTITPFTSTIPSSIFIVGDATAGGWSNPVPTPSQQFTQIDAVTFGTVMKLNGGKSYLLLPSNGNWNPKYAVASSSANPAGDNFGYYDQNANPQSAFNTNIPSPTADGLYQMLANFQTLKYSVTPFTGVYPVPSALYIVGDATAGQWNNPVPTPSQQFTQISLTDFQLTVALTAGKSYLLLPSNGNWNPKYAVASASANPLGDNFGYYDQNAVPASAFNTNIPAPAVSGNYLIDVNFATGKYTVTKQ